MRISLRSRVLLLTLPRSCSPGRAGDVDAATRALPALEREIARFQRELARLAANASR